ncbi:XylR family transcriptional regulator [Lacunimicrobium album]|jgi:LacI family transcriptional regulator
MATNQHVALIIETSTAYGRNLLRGVIRYMRLHEEWSIFLEQRDIESKLPGWIFDWRGDGMMSRKTSPELAERVKAHGTPFVELTDRGQTFGFPMVRSDDAAIGQMAAEHYLDRGYQHFAFCGYDREVWSQRREEAFGKLIKDSQQSYSTHHLYWNQVKTDPWLEERQQLAAWLSSLPKPVGIFACNDDCGYQIIDACRNVGINSPEEVAVLGVDDDDVLCQLCKPSLSSIIPNAEGIGYRAAELLAKLIEGKPVENEVLLLPPLGITTRQSTDHTAIDDPELAYAIHMIRERACQGMTVSDILAQVPLSRSSLERRMRKYLKRSPQQEIRHIQLKRAMRLLRETDMPIEAIARSCGFENPEYMHVVFRREYDMTPGDYRRNTKT